ncbi:polysaccharide deacetylase family protein [Kordiimonas sp. SCSIO 12610]|uniref:polysaccharide deacetylase family protein n=1 Tax=Kordiimonas sp. SCSIO 12610 TaxID=2829597 RepID=UPI0021098F94|nr:polysaccharide deacetylase family protein [Kordiimonas sp. SCSIO 12610]UTW55085.1 polysaccharide deacetylase family protein [Kordiimonas sp. SCSIO 12610]
MQIYKNIVLMMLAVLGMSISIDAQTDESIVFLIYHRFGEDRYPSTNIRLDQFDAQIEELRSGDYTFMKMSDAVNRLLNKESVPEKAVVVTVDDAFKSVLTEAWPRLKQAGIPLTLFVSTDLVDKQTPGYLNWDEIRQLRSDGVEIGHHGAAHSHLLYEEGSGAQDDIERASKRFEDELGFIPGIFAYPYGEYDQGLINLIERLGFKAAFAQYSGAAPIGGNHYAIPRYPVNERYGNLDRFRLIAKSKALPVRDIIPTSVTLLDEQNPPSFGFTVDSSLTSLDNLACYPSHLGEAAKLIKLDGNRVEVRFNKPFPPGRNRINCTLPAGNGRWYWLGRYFLVPGGVPD